MASYSILQNTPLPVVLPADMANQGWTVSDGIATHSGCSNGFIDYFFDLSAAEKWTFKYVINELKTGTVNIVVNDLPGELRSVAGTYEETFDVTGDNLKVRLYSTGEASLKDLQVYPFKEASNAATFGFNEGADKWSSNYSFIPEFMCKFLNDFFTFKDGQLWQHNVNTVHNNFYGEQFTSQLRFVANSDYQKNKMYFVMKIDSNGRWAVPSITTPVSETWPNGMKSILHENNFDLDNGKYWADILRDMNDPEFDDELQALFEGRTITGPMLICELESKETKEVKLNGVFIYSAEQDRNF